GVHAAACRYGLRLARQDRLGSLVRPGGLEPARVAPLAPQRSASTSPATTAVGGVVRACAGATPLDVTNRPGRNKGCKSASTVRGRAGRSGRAKPLQEAERRRPRRR